MEALIDTYLRASLQMQDVFHGFRARIGMGTSIMELKLAQELAIIDQDPSSWYYWTSGRHTTPWTGNAFSSYWKGLEQDLVCVDSSRPSGAVNRWYRDRTASKDRPSLTQGVQRRLNLYP